MGRAKPPTVTTASPHPFEKAFPTTTTTVKFVVAVIGLVGAAMRGLWPWRREVGGLVVVSGTWIGLGHMLPGWWALAATIGLLGAPVLHPIVRRRVGLWMHCGRVRRWLIVGLDQTRFANPNGALPRIRRVRATPVGERVWLRLRPGQSIELLEGKVEELRASVRAQDVRLTRDPRRAHLVTVDVIRRDTLTHAPPVAWLNLHDEVLSIWDRVHFGISELGEAVWLFLVERAILIGGNRGAGKSNLLNLIVAHAAKSPDAELVLIDANRIQLAPWAARARLFADHDPDTAIGVLQQVQDELDRRLDWLVSLPGSPVALTRQLSHEHKVPMWLVVIDELAYHTSVAGTGVQQKAFYNLLRDIVARGRASGIVVVAATQRPTHDLVPTSLRDLFDIRIAFRTMTRTSSDVILGDDFARRGFSATDIDLNSRGVNWLFAEDRDPIRTKTTWITPETRVELAVTTVRHKPAPALLSVPTRRDPEATP
jgi:S-DNA-T family DNA segregation ATPase FtsK/SpoIIIE